MAAVNLQMNKPYFEVLPVGFKETFNDRKYAEFYDIKVRKINKTRAYVGKVVLLKPLDNSLTVEVQAFYKQGGEYRLLPFRQPPEPFCSFVSNDSFVYPDLAKNSDFPKDIEANCPLAVGEYKLNGVNYDMDNLPKSIARSGEYAAELSMRKDKTLVFQFRIYGTVNNI